MSELRLAVLGCGDFARWQSGSLKKSKLVKPVGFFDLDAARAKRYADEFGAAVCDSPEAIFADADVHAVALFVPPWVRKGLFLQAVRAGKHVICTKPLASTVADCQEMRAAAEKAGIRTGVIYKRTEDAAVEAAKSLFEDGRLGGLALYRQDWIHAYPQWNDWATDPQKNGGPFMDAMIHNLNIANYLMGRPVTEATLYSDRLAHPDLPCADTEGMIVRYEGGGLSNLFITWAADLATYGTDGNDREHIDLFYMVTDRGWRITQDRRDGKGVLVASREGKEEVVPCPPLGETHYDGFAEYVAGGQRPRTLVDLETACEDLALVRQEPK